MIYLFCFSVYKCFYHISIVPVWRVYVKYFGVRFDISDPKSLNPPETIIYSMIFSPDKLAGTKILILDESLI